MNPIWKLILAAVSAYLLGNFNTAIVVSSLILKDDIRNHGSGNGGFTNALRIYGKKWALVVGLGDTLKGILAVFVAGWLLHDTVYIAAAQMLALVFVVLGHVYPVFFGFKGGKGVLTTAAVLPFVDWRVFLIAIAIWVVIVLTTRYSSLGSILGAMSIPFSMWAFRPTEWLTIAVSGGIALMVVYLHRANIGRLWRGTESKMSLSRAGKRE